MADEEQTDATTPDPEPVSDASESEEAVNDPTPDGESSESPNPDAEALLAAAQAAVNEISDDTTQAATAETGGTPDGQQLDLPDLSGAAAGGDAEKLELLDDVDLDVKIELGRTSMLIEDVLRLNEGAVVELDKLAGDPVDVFVNDRIVARGEVLVLNDNFCVRINEVLDRAAMEAAQRSGRAAG